MFIPFNFFSPLSLTKGQHLVTGLYSLVVLERSMLKYCFRVTQLFFFPPLQCGYVIKLQHLPLSVFLTGSSPPSYPGWSILYVLIYIYLDTRNITVIVKVRMKGTLREVPLPPSLFSWVSFHPVYIPGSLSPTSPPTPEASIHLSFCFILLFVFEQMSRYTYIFLYSHVSYTKGSTLPFALSFFFYLTVYSGNMQR